MRSTYPADFRDSKQNADPAVVRAVTALQAAFAAGDAAAAVALMSVDVVHGVPGSSIWGPGQAR